MTQTQKPQLDIPARPGARPGADAMIAWRKANPSGLQAITQNRSKGPYTSKSDLSDKDYWELIGDQATD